MTQVELSDEVRMQIRNWPSSSDLSATYRLACDLGLESNLFELNTFGLTVIRNAIDPDTVNLARQRLLEIASMRGAPQSMRGADLPTQYRGVGALLHYILFEDVVFEQLLMNPNALALVDYLVGTSCLLSSCTGMIKGPTEEPSTLHTDNGMIPSPFPQYAMVANATWVLTDYTEDGGCLFHVPGSHLHCRHPTEGERLDLSIRRPVEAPAGSLIVWHGNLWHGAYARRRQDYRVNLIMLYCRMCCITQEIYGDRAPAESLQRNGERFATLMGHHVAYGWDRDGPDFSHHNRQKYLDLHRNPLEHLYS